eukprot:UN07864
MKIPNGFRPIRARSSATRLPSIQMKKILEDFQI